ncbi:MAG: porphobilinogen synthase [Flavobacteriaceae bacterium]
MNYPRTRLRRLRYNKNVRELFEDVSIAKSDLIQPVFLVEGKNIKKEIKSLSGQYQLSIDNALIFCTNLINEGINSIILFGVSSKKDDTGKISCSSKSIVPKAIKEIKKTFGDKLLVMADVCNCSYTNHGHCGTIVDNDVHNDLTLETLSMQALTLAKAGADVLAPSDMMDGRVQSIRNKLDSSGFEKIPVFPYSVKYASAFYGPFRDAVGSGPKKGDRKSYQMSFKNSKEYFREVEQDLTEGADAIIIKPALAYLDVISKVSNNYNIPIIAYNVSGEYSMIKSSAEKGHINEMDIIMETMCSMKRAGANAIITYFAFEIAKNLNSNV